MGNARVPPRAWAAPKLPWRRDELRQVLDAHAALTDRLTPSPVQTVALAETGDEFDCWLHLAENAA